MGRFTSPDPHNEGAQLVDPQSWNVYAYGRNNPLKFTDPTGEAVQVCTNDENGKTTCVVMSDPQYAAAVAGNNPGISAPAAGATAGPGGGLALGGSITCGGVVCGSATYQEESMQDTSPEVAAVVEAAAGAVGAAEAGAARAATRYGTQIARNAVKGSLAERLAEATLRLKGYKIVGRHVTARTSKGIRYVDYVVEKGGEFAAIEVKSGGAVRNAGQLAKDAAMETEGAVIGNNGGALQGLNMKLKTIEVHPF
jgi:hypothetical protein